MLYLKYLIRWIKFIFRDGPAPWGLLSIYRSRVAFHAAVRKYPEHTPPYPGSGRKITPEQAQANLDWFLASMPEHLNHLDTLLAQFGIPTTPAGDTLHDMAEWMNTLIAWTYQCWPEEPFQPEHKYTNARHTLRRVGDAAIFSIILDLATKIGEIIIKIEPRWHWGLDMDKFSLRAQLLTSRRILLTTAPLGNTGIREMDDWEGAVTSHYKNTKRFFTYKDIPRNFTLDSWLIGFYNACAGYSIDSHRWRFPFQSENEKFNNFL